jgi:hypothetical protein
MKNMRKEGKMNYLRKEENPVNLERNLEKKLLLIHNRGKVTGDNDKTTDKC